MAEKEEALIERPTVATDDFNEMELREYEKDGQQPQLSSSFKSFINSCKIFLGNTFLTIPYVFKHTGWLGGIVLYSVIALFSTYTMKILMDVSHGLSKQVQDDGKTRNVRTLSEVALRVQGKTGKILVDVFTFLTQLGRCASFIYFIAE